MQRIIIPVDFSDTSLNAARFAANMLSGKPDTLVILYNNYSHDSEYEPNKTHLESLQKELLDKGDTAVEYELEKDGDLIDNLDRLAHTRRATLIVMGLTGRSGLQQKFIGSNTLKTVDRSLYPVMIIPPDASFAGIKNVAFASDFTDVENSTPSTLINKVLELFNPKLHVVNVNPDHYISINEECRQQQEKLAAMFEGREIEFYFLTLYDFQEAISSFLTDYSIDMLITIPRHHSGHSGLWETSNTRKLAYHSHIPILTAHQ
ncbi:MAG: universal stress protein [Chitinophagaceae bacterium]